MASEESSSYASASASSSAGDSYIGSLISLTSKCEIRYEGILVSINPQESTIALRNVRSYGTEGRKKDGPQIPPSDKEYEYILFRGSDIKDLQVKSSPSIHTKPQLHNDPAIIQSQYAYAPTSHRTSASVGGGTLTGLSSHALQPDLARQPYPDAFSLYQIGAHLNSWVSSPAPTNTDGASLTTPMYSQGYVGALSGQAHAQPQSVPYQSQSVLLQNQLKYPEGYAPTSMLNLPELAAPLTFSSTVTPSQFAISNPAYSSSSLSSNTLLPSPSSSLPSHLPIMPSLASSNQEVNSINLISGKAGPSPASFLPIQSLPSSSSLIMGSYSGPLTTLPPLLTPDQLTNYIPTATSSLQKSYPEPTNPPSSVCAMPQAPLLPLPMPSQQDQRGLTQFTEEFDFTAMNEKFNKDEVWGSLGKEKQRGTTGDEAEEDPIHYNVEVEQGYAQDPKLGRKPVYSKDDFFDTLSCNSLNRGAWSGRTKFTERMKLDTETFGEFQQRPPLGHGNHGAFHSGRGSYNRGRGYGYYGGRGRSGYRPI